MRCPFCKAEDTRVLDTRGGDGQAIRRRRKCDVCSRRFTTYERVELNLPMVVKRHGERQPFDTAKIRKGIERACQKRPLSAAQLDALAEAVEGHFAEHAEREISSEQVGAEVLRRLKAIDDVAYVRFASVYRQFTDVSQFLTELEVLAAAAAARRDTLPPGPGAVRPATPSDPFAGLMPPATSTGPLPLPAATGCPEGVAGAEGVSGAEGGPLDEPTEVDGSSPGGAGGA